MKRFPGFILLLLFNASYGQVKIVDPSPLIGHLHGPVKSIRFVHTNMDQYNSPTTDSSFYYELSLARDTGMLYNGLHTIRIYNEKGQLEKKIIMTGGQQFEEKQKLDNFNKVVIDTFSAKMPDYTRVDTTRNYYDKAGNLVKTIDNDNISSSRFTTIYEYDKLNNLVEKRFYSFNGEIGEKEELSELVKISYRLDQYKNWVFQKLEFVSPRTGKPYQTVTYTRIISYN